MDVYTLLSRHVNVTKFVDEDADKDQRNQSKRKEKNRGTCGEAKAAPVNEHPEEHQHKGWMEPYFYSMEARDG
jgi:hypothetical protein